MSLTHGGDVEGYMLETGLEPLDFSSNANPIGMPKRAEKAIRHAAKRASAYPDPLCRRLRESLAREQGLNPDHIICGNGAADIIFRLAIALRPKTALVLAPTFAEYNSSLDLVGTEVRYHLLKREEGFAVTSRLLDDLTPDLDVFYLCNPTHPTGLTCDPDLLDQVETRCRENGTILAVDECFMGFVDHGNRLTLRDRIPEDSNLLIFDAFTKLFGMAGIRLGYCLSSNAELLEKISDSGQPWPVSSIAQAAGIAALKKDHTYLQETRQLVATERTWLYKRLKKLGFEVYPGEADYLFFYSDITDLAERMRGQGILIRDCSNYVGLEPGAYRVAVRQHEENEALITAFKRVLKGDEPAEESGE